jgi:hypothetical protein
VWQAVDVCMSVRLVLACKHAPRGSIVDVIYNAHTRTNTSTRSQADDDPPTHMK